MAIWSASGYVGAFTRASNAIYEVARGPAVLEAAADPAGRHHRDDLAARRVRVAVVVTGPVAQQLGDVVGAGSAAVTAWDIAKWPILALVVT